MIAITTPPAGDDPAPIEAAVIDAYQEDDEIEERVEADLWWFGVKPLPEIPNEPQRPS
jgi:hypothetical protein